MAKYSTPPKKISELTKGDVQNLITATEEVFAGDLFGGGSINRNLKEPYTTPDRKFHWDKNEDLFNYVADLTNTNDVRSANAVLYETLPTTTEVPVYKDSNTTALRSDELKNLEESAQIREVSKSEAKEKGVRETKEFIESQLKRQKTIRVIPKQEIPTITLSQNDKQKLHDLGVAAKTDPGTTQKMVEEKIQESLQKSSEEIKGIVSKDIVTKTAVDFVNRTKPFGDYKTAEEIPDKIDVVNPISPVIAITAPTNQKFKELVTNDEYRTLIAQNAQSIALAFEAERNVNTTLTSQLIYSSPNVTSVLYGPEQITEFEIADDQKDEGGVELNIEDVIDQGKDIRDFWDKIATKRTTATEAAEATSEFVSSYTPSTNFAISSRASSLLSGTLTSGGGLVGARSGMLLSGWAAQGNLLMSPSVAGWITSGGFGTTAIASTATTGNILFNANLGKFSFSIISASNGPRSIYLAGASFGNKAFGGYVGKIAGKTVAAGTLSKVGGQIAVKAVPSAVLSKIGGLLGTAGTPIMAAVGAAAGWVAGKVIEKIPWKKILPFVTGVATALIAGPLLGVFAGLGTAAIIGGLGGGSSLSAMVAGIGNFFLALGKITATTIGVPILVTLLVFPVVVALILFIINSGAYIVPPSASTIARLGQVVSPYIEVKKTANPAGPFQNSQLPITVEYTVEIIAKKGPLTNIQIDDDCSVRKASGDVPCPVPNPSIPSTIGPSEDAPEGTSGAVGPTQPHTFKYSMTFNSPNFIDSRVSNSITVTADADGQSGATAAGSASIKIGNPPEDCPADWPVYPEGEPYLSVYQGPHTSNGTHDTIEAIDIFSPDEPLNLAILGNQVKATHTGKVVVGSGGNYGRYVDVTSTCKKANNQEVEVTTRYAHLSAVSVVTGQNAGKDQTIGLAGSSGTPYPHVHYEFRPAPGPVPMNPPYLPKSIPTGCRSLGSPCNVTY